MSRPKGANGKHYYGVALLEKISIFSSKSALYSRFPLALKLYELPTRDINLSLNV